MGCISSSPAGADKADGNAKRKTLGGGNMREASTKLLGTNCQSGHPLDKYDVLDTLGTGGFAVVKRVRSKMTGENFAMKIINVTFDPVRASPPTGAKPRIESNPSRSFSQTVCSPSLQPETRVRVRIPSVPSPPRRPPFAILTALRVASPCCF